MTDNQLFVLTHSEEHPKQAIIKAGHFFVDVWEWMKFIGTFEDEGITATNARVTNITVLLIVEARAGVRGSCYIPNKLSGGLPALITADTRFLSAVSKNVNPKKNNSYVGPNNTILDMSAYGRILDETILLTQGVARGIASKDLGESNLGRAANVSPVFDGALNRDAMATIMRSIFEKSELSQREFCEDHQINRSDFNRILAGTATIDKSLEILTGLGVQARVEAFENDKN